MYQINRRSLVIAALNTATTFFLLTAANAAAETETFSSSEQLGAVTQADSIALPSFNSNLGTLQNVVITMQFNICPIIAIDNSTSTPLQFSTLVVTAPFSVSGPGGLTYNDTLSTWSASGTAAPGMTDYVPKTGWLYTVQGVNAANLALWQDQPGNNVSLVVTPGELGTKTTTTPLPTGLTTSATAQEWENISVKYTYLSTAAVPEPSGKFLACIVGTMMGLFVIGRRLRIGA